MDNTTPRIIIAVDGYSSSGKSTMARALAARLGYRYIDSGAMYRAVTLYALEHGFIAAVGTVDTAALIAALPEIKIDFIPTSSGVQHTLLNGRDVEEEIRDLPVSENVSTIAAIPEIRHALVKMQQAFGKSRGIVMDGRDIGTTVFPEAELKIFVNAPAETRARRRLAEMTAAGLKVTYEEILDNIRHRDHIDETRSESPLRRASDAIDLDNSNMTHQQQDLWLMEQVNQTLEKIKEGGHAQG
ncbi:MAG: (d)CMP kinase [Muribaculaceae bacterium]|nr:(d)CMP kinase [Muribaculaceae bacterium]